MRALHGAAAIFVLAAIFVGAPAVHGADSADSSQSTGERGVKLAARITLYREINSLSLTPIQVKVITPRLVQLDEADRSYKQHYRAAAGPAVDTLQRIADALMKGRPAAADEFAAREALSPLDAEAGRLFHLRQLTIETARRTLTPRQIQLVRADVGISRPPVLPDIVSAAAGADRAGSAAQPRFSADTLRSMMETYRKMPPDTFEQNRIGADDGKTTLTYNGVVMTDPIFTAANGGLSFLDQMALIRQMSDDQFQAAEDHLASQLAEQYSGYADETRSFARTI